MCSKNLVVDLDGTLIYTDMLIENIFLFLRHYPLYFFKLFVWVLKGKLNLKKNLASQILPEVESLPYNKALLGWLKNKKQEGYTLTLATASDQRIAQKISDHLGIFEQVLGSENNNLSSNNKKMTLVDLFGFKNFEYIGNSKDDLAVWEAASVIHIVNPTPSLLKSAQNLGIIGEIFNNPISLRTIFKALRVHQWAKNILIFVPLLTSHRLFELALLWNAFIAFIAFGACASSVYLLNDLLDLPDDRRHSTKCKRPLAAGTLPIRYALILMPTLLFSAFILAFLLLPIEFTITLAIYYLLTLSYSLWLKRIVMLDVITLAILYTIRVIAGVAATTETVTFWILAFSTFIFLSLAFVKRYTELFNIRQIEEQQKAHGRGYYAGDFELLASLGGASGYISVLVLALYINEATKTQLYHSPEWMWLACPLLLYWISRIWLLAHRGKMHDDPIVFALRDKISRWTGGLFIVVFVIAI